MWKPPDDSQAKLSRNGTLRAGRFTQGTTLLPRSLCDFLTDREFIFSTQSQWGCLFCSPCEMTVVIRTSTVSPASLASPHFTCFYHKRRNMLPVLISQRARYLDTSIFPTCCTWLAKGEMLSGQLFLRPQFVPHT